VTYPHERLTVVLVVLTGALVAVTVVLALQTERASPHLLFRSMSAVWIGFVGVIVGSVISIAWSWLAVIRQELSDAMVSARLVDENLAALDEAIRASRGKVSPQISLDIWKQNRAALARVLGEQQWDEVSAVYRHGDQQLPEDSLSVYVSTARSALRELVAGKRYVIPQRWRNALSRHRSGRDTSRSPSRVPSQGRGSE
jgi:hypothetical protein